MLSTNPFTDDLFGDDAHATQSPRPLDVSGPRASDTDQGPTLLADLDTTTPPAAPSLLQIDGTDNHLLYAEKVNLIFGAPGTGKSHVALHLQHQQAQAGKTTLLLDYEKTAQVFAQRANEHAIPTALHPHLAYWRPARPLAHVIDAVLSFAHTHDVATVVIDGVGQALAYANIDENDNTRVAAWFETATQALTGAGLTVLLLDHSGHASTNPGRHPHPVGASAKLRYTTGALLHIATRTPFSKHLVGHAAITCLKDNQGEFPAGQHVADFHVTPGADAATFRLAPPATSGDLTAQVLDYARDYHRQHGRGPSKNQVRTGLGHSDEARSAAIHALVTAGAMTVVRDGNALRLTPTRSDEDAHGPS